MTITAIQLQAKVSADTSEAEKGLQSVKEKADQASGDSGGGGIKGFISRVAQMVTAGAILEGVRSGFEFLGDQVKDCINVAAQYEYVQAQTNAVLKSTKDASGMTAQGIADLAEKLSTITPFSRDATQAAENMLLTFTNIKGNLPQVTQTTLDFATAMHMDATTAALQLGKALNDPATGYSKLQREGVTFSKSQIESIKAMEKSGNTAGAQAIMLKELQKEFGGSATAAGSTFAGSLQILQNQLEDTKDSVGAALIPVLSQLLTALAPLMAAFAQFVSKALGGLSSFLTSDVIPTMQQWLPVIGTILQAAQTLGGVFMSALQPAIEQIQQAFSKMHGPGLSVQQVVGGIAQVVQRLTPFVAQAGRIFGQLAVLFVTQMLPAMLRFGQFIAATILPVLKDLGQFIATQVIPVVMQLAGFFVTNVMPVLQQVEGVIVSSLVPAFKQIMDAIITNVWPSVKQLIKSLEDLWNRISPILIPVLQFLGNLLKNVIAPVIAHTVVPVIGLVIGAVGGFINGISTLIGWIGNLLGFLGKIKDFLGNEFTNAWNNITGVVKGVWNGISDAVKGGIDGVISIINGLISAIDNISINVPQVGPFGGGHIGFSIPKIPYLAEGGDVTRGGEAIVGDRGPERISLPTGARVTPLPAGLSAATSSAAPVHITTQLVVDGRKMAEVVTKHQPTVIRNATGARAF